MTSDCSNAAPQALPSSDGCLTLTVDEAAAMLGISRGLAYELVRQGRLPSVRLGRRILVPRAALVAFLDQQATTDAVA